MFGCAPTGSLALRNNNAKGNLGSSASLALRNNTKGSSLLGKRSGMNVLNGRGFGGLVKKNRKRSIDSKDSRPRKTRKTNPSESGKNELPLLRGPNPLAQFKQKTLPLNPFKATEGLHPALFDAKFEIEQITKKLNKVEEQSQFWRRKSYTLQGELAKCKKEVSELRAKVDSMEMERLQLQTKLLAANADKSKCLESIKSLMQENEDLKGVVSEVNEELRMLGASPAAAENMSMESGDVDRQHLLDLEAALRDTLADLSDKIEEIEVLKRALQKVSVEKHNLDEVVTKDMLLKEMITLSEDEQEDAQGSPEMAKIIRLQEAVEKCMFRIALLSQKNEELQKNGSGGDFSPTLLETLEDDKKVVVLESMCMQRYRKLLRKAAQSLVGTEVAQDQMDESF